MRVTTVFSKLLALQGAFVQRVEFTADGIVGRRAEEGMTHERPSRAHFAHELWAARGAAPCRARVVWKGPLGIL